MTPEPRAGKPPEPRDAWPCPRDTPEPRWEVARTWYDHPQLFTVKDIGHLRSDLDYLDDQISEWEAKESKLDDVETGYWPAALIAVALLLTNGKIWTWWSDLPAPWAVLSALGCLLLLPCVLWLPLIGVSRLAVRLNMGDALPDLRKVRRLYRIRLRELEGEQSHADESAPNVQAAPDARPQRVWQRWWKG